MIRAVQLFLLTPLLVALLSPPVVVHAEQLQPTCGEVDTATFSSATVSVYQMYGTALQIECFSYLFQPNVPTCNATNASIVLTITGPGSAREEIDLIELFRASTYAAQFKRSDRVHFAIEARYPNWNWCPTTLLSSIYGSYTTASGLPNVPSLLSVRPSILTENVAATLYFSSPVALSNPTAVHVVLIDEGLTCFDNAQIAWTLSPGTASWSAANPKVFQFPVTVGLSGQYRVCVWTADANTWSLAALVQVFGGNPAYYIISTTTQSASGETDKLVFYGQNLQAARDSVKVIDDDGTLCSASAASSSTATVYGLYPSADRAGTVVTVDFEYVLGGQSYKICYFAIATGAWTNVPDFGSMTREVINGLPDARRTNTSNATNFTCAATPPDPTYNQVTTSDAVLIVVNGKRLPTSLDSTLAAFLCLQPSEVIVAAFDPATPSSRIVVQVHCTVTDCNDAERQHALSLITARELPALVRAAVIPFNGIDVDGSSSSGGNSAPDDPVGQGAVVLGIGIAMSLFLVLVTMAVIYLIKRRHTARLAHGGPGVVEGAPVMAQVDVPNITYTSGAYVLAQPINAAVVETSPAPAQSAPARRRQARDVDAGGDADAMRELAVPLSAADEEV